MPGGCNIGPRRIDFHIRGLQRLGATIEIDHGYIEVRADRLHGAVVPLDYPSVGATENLLMAATAASGTTVIENAAREPEIVDLAKFLMSMGAQIDGAGTSAIRIEGGHALHGTTHEVIADRIEAGTFLAAAAVTGGDVTVRGLSPLYLELFLTKMRALGVRVDEADREIRAIAGGPLSPVDVSTLPHPGFATDLQAQFMVALTLAAGTSIVTENVFENRFAVVDELNRLGAGISTSGHHAVVAGPRAADRHGRRGARPARWRGAGARRPCGRGDHRGAWRASRRPGLRGFRAEAERARRRHRRTSPGRGVTVMSARCGARRMRPSRRAAVHCVQPAARRWTQTPGSERA